MFEGKSFSLKDMPKIVSIGCAGKILKVRNQNLKKINKKPFSQKTIPKTVSMIVHRKDIKKQNSKTKKRFSTENQFHKSLSQRS